MGDKEGADCGKNPHPEREGAHVLAIFGGRGAFAFECFEKDQFSQRIADVLGDHNEKEGAEIRGLDEVADAGREGEEFLGKRLFRTIKGLRRGGKKLQPFKQGIERK